MLLVASCKTVKWRLERSCCRDTKACLIGVQKSPWNQHALHTPSPLYDWICSYVEADKYCRGSSSVFGCRGLSIKMLQRTTQGVRKAERVCRLHCR